MMAQEQLSCRFCFILCSRPFSINDIANTIFLVFLQHQRGLNHWLLDTEEDTQYRLAVVSIQIEHN